MRTTLPRLSRITKAGTSVLRPVRPILLLVALVATMLVVPNNIHVPTASADETKYLEFYTPPDSFASGQAGRSDPL